MFINEPIFGRKQVVESNVSKVSYETDDFDATSSLLEGFISLEQSFMEITRDQMTALHYGLIDEDAEILREGLGDTLLSAANFFVDMIKKFSDIIKRLFMIIRSYLGNFEKFIDKYKNVLNNLSPNFTIKGYNYDFEPTIPRTDRISAIVNNFNSELNEIKNMTKEDIAKEREEFNSDEYMNKIRAEVIGVSGSITKEEFVREVQKKYRGGNTDPVEIKVDKVYFNKAVSTYPELKKLFNESAKERDRVLLLINSMKTFFERGVNFSKSGDIKTVQSYKLDFNDNKSGVTKSEAVSFEGSSENYEKLNIFYNFKLLQAKELGSIVITAVVQKVNALKEALKQYETVIRKAVISKNNKGEEVKK